MYAVFLRRYKNHPNTASRTAAAPTPAPIPPAAAGESPPDEFPEGVSVGLGSDEEVDKEPVDEGDYPNRGSVHLQNAIPKTRYIPV